MKKEYYEKPETEINEFKTVDVIITTSGGGEDVTNPGDDNPTTWPFG